MCVCVWVCVIKSIYRIFIVFYIIYVYGLCSWSSVFLSAWLRESARARERERECMLVYGIDGEELEA